MDHSAIPHADDPHRKLCSTLEEYRALIEGSRRAIDESRALLYEISRRHPEIDFDAVRE